MCADCVNAPATPLLTGQKGEDSRGRWPAGRAAPGRPYRCDAAGQQIGTSIESVISYAVPAVPEVDLQADQRR